MHAFGALQELLALLNGSLHAACDRAPTWSVGEQACRQSRPALQSGSAMHAATWPRQFFSMHATAPMPDARRLSTAGTWRGT